MSEINSPGFKIIGIGLGKTGTSTFADCMRVLGYKHVTGPVDIRLLTRFEKVKEILSQADSFDDFPWPYLYKDIVQLYPDARFVLTSRTDVCAWYESLCKWYCRTGPTESKHGFYGYYSPYENPDHHKTLYLNHNKAAREFFMGSPNFIELSWDGGDGWEKLCGFLNIGIPTAPLPHRKRSPSDFDYHQGRTEADKKLAKLRLSRGIVSNSDTDLPPR